MIKLVFQDCVSGSVITELQTAWLPKVLQFLMRNFDLKVAEAEAHVCDLYGCNEHVFLDSVNNCPYQ